MTAPVAKPNQAKHLHDYACAQTASRFAIYGLRMGFIAINSGMELIDQDAEALRGAVAWALQLADQQGNTLAAALLEDVLTIVSDGLPD